MSKILQTIAVVGIGCRFPGDINNPQLFWEALLNRKNCIRKVPEDRWNVDRFVDKSTLRNDRIVSSRGGFIKNVDSFDAQFFGFSSREAESIDPQQRLLLEVAYEALEDAGINPDTLSNKNVGVFMGVSSHDYADLQQKTSTADIYTNAGKSTSMIANRISYVFNLKGPSLTVDTACSSSLTALHLAFNSLVNQESFLAIVGGVNVIINPNLSIGFSRAGMLSPEGFCKSFDANGDGYVRSEGAGVVVLMPLEMALVQQLDIYAIVKGTMVNQDGKTNGITLPSQEAQQFLLSNIYARLNIDVNDVSYIEAHGTGTSVGDPIELNAIGNVLGKNRPKISKIKVGSVKSNIGHLEAASGIAGFIKVALCLKKRMLVSNLHFKKPHPEIPFDQLNIEVQVRIENWESQKGQLIAGVNSFGFGGTNVHVVLTSWEGDNINPPSQTLPSQTQPTILPFPITAKSSTSLINNIKNILEYLKSNLNTSINNLSYTLCFKRQHHHLRKVFFDNSVQGLIEQLTDYLASVNQENITVIRAKPIKKVFVFSGQGSQWWAMGRSLIKKEPLFLEVINECDRLFSKLTNWSIYEEIHRDETTSKIERTDIAQPAIFAIQIALATLWISFGITPDVIVGHSVGEVAAAYIAGVYTLEQAIEVVYHRSRLQHLTSGTGKMLAISMSEEKARDMLNAYPNKVYIAAINSSKSLTLAGDEQSLTEISTALESQSIFNRFLKINYAFHSPFMEPIKEELLTCLQLLTAKVANIPLYSTVTGGKTSGEDWDGHYWWQNVRSPVLFDKVINQILDDIEECLFIEIGPHPVLKGAITEILSNINKPIYYVNSLNKKNEERAIYDAVGNLFSLGFLIHWQHWITYGSVAKIPNYAWDWQIFWKEPIESNLHRTSKINHPFLSLLNLSENSWKIELSLASFPFLNDHKIEGIPIFPGAGYIDLVLAISRFERSYSVLLEEISFENPLIVPVEEATSLLIEYDLNLRMFKCFSSKEGQNKKILHCLGNCRDLPQNIAPLQPISIQQLINKYSQQVSIKSLYASLSHFGLDYGPYFQGLIEVYLDTNSSLSKVLIDSVHDDNFRKFCFHPSYLDACFQSAFTTLDLNAFELDSMPVILPTYIKEFRIYKKATKVLWVKSTLLKQTSFKLEVDLEIYDDCGEPVSLVRGFQCKVVKKIKNSPNPNELFYQYTWQAQLLINENNKIDSKTILIYVNQAGLKEIFKKELGQNNTLLFICPGNKQNNHTDNTFLVNPNSPNDFLTVLSHINDRSLSIDYIIFMCQNRLRHKPVKNIAIKNSLALFHLVQSLASYRINPGYHLWIVTKFGQQVLSNEPMFGVSQSLLWGLGRVVMNEYPQWQCRLIDLDNNNWMSKLCESISSSSSENEIAYRNGNRYVRRLSSLSQEYVYPKTEFKAINPNKSRFSLEKSSTNSIDELFLQEQPCSILNKGDVEIQVKAAGINFRDVMKVLGIYPTEDPDDTYLGDECSGIITKVGQDVTKYEVGDEVIVLYPNAFSSFITCPADYAIKKPKDISFEQAAGIPIIFITAYYSLIRLANLKRGERVLIHAASGGVGLASIELSKMLGAEIYATAGSEQKRAFLANMGVKYIYDSRKLDFRDEILKITNNEGVDVILNSLTGDTFETSLALLKPFGRFLEIGKVDIYKNSKLNLWELRNNISFHAIDLTQVFKHQPKLTRQIFEKIIALFNLNKIKPITTQVFSICDASTAFRYIAKSKHIGKVVLAMNDKKVTAKRIPEVPKKIKSRGTYIITGGYSGLGFQTAKWLIKNGAKTIILVGKSGNVSEDINREIQKLKKQNLTVEVVKCDIAKSFETKALFKHIRNNYPPIRGIFHAAMVLHDGLITHLNKQSFLDVLNPKVLGIWNLHDNSLLDPIDYFVSYSSVSSLLGSIGQANYAAANMLLDDFSKFRHQLGFPALTINWGVIEQVGYVARHLHVAQMLDRQGLKGISPQQVLEILGYLLNRDINHIGVINIDWNQLFTVVPHLSSSPKLGDIYENYKSKNTSNYISIKNLFVLEPSERKIVIQQWLIKNISYILRIPSLNIDMSASLTALGVDSLIVVELRNRIYNEYRIEVNHTDIMQNSSIEKLVDVIIKKYEEMQK